LGQEVFFTITTPFGVKQVDLPHLIEACCQDDVISMPLLAPHQHTPMVELLAVIICAGRLYGATNTSSAAKWRTLLEGVPLDIIPEDGQAGFLQPYVPDARWNDKPFEYLDATPSASEHPVKSTWSTNPEQAIMALIGGLRMGVYGAGHHAAKVRERLIAILVSKKGTISDEVLTLAQHLPTRPGSCLADHLLWSQEWHAAQIDTLPLPIVDCRSVRLRKDGDAVGGQWATAPVPRVIGDWFDDPHTPQDLTTGKAYRLSTARDMSHHVQHSVFFGEPDKVRRPQILDRVEGPYIVRITSTYHPKQSGVSAFYQDIVTVTGGLLDADRCTKLSEAALVAVSTAERTFRASAALLFNERHRPGESMDRTMPHAMYLTRQLTREIGPASVHEVIRLVPLGRDVNDQSALHAMAIKGIRTIWASVIDTVSLYNAALATNLLQYLVNLRLKTTEEDTVMVVYEPHTRHIFTLLREMTQTLTPSQRATIRASSSSDSFSYGALVALSRAPWRDQNDSFRASVWMTAIKGLARLYHGGPSIGKSLAEVEYPWPRMNKLLASSGDALVAQMDEAIRWTVAKRVTTINLSDLVAFALTEDQPARSQLRLKIARDYVRAAERIKATRAA
jgi:hypothetical protein